MTWTLEDQRAARRRYARSAKGLAKQRAWRKANLDEARAYARAYAKRPDQKQKARERRAANKDAANAKARARYAANPEPYRERSRLWAMRNPEKVRSIKRRAQSRRIARRNEAFVEDLDPQKVLERASGRCGICGNPVDSSNFQVDHIVPLAKGGQHCYANAQPAHPLCNQRKGAS